MQWLTRGVLTEAAARWLLVLHTALGVAAVGAATHLVLWLRRLRRGQLGRLRAVRRFAWILLALQLLSIVIGTIGKSISTPEHPVRLDAGFSTNGWLAVLLMFVLAAVFAEGTRMRDDLEGTV